MDKSIFIIMMYGLSLTFGTIRSLDDEQLKDYQPKAPKMDILPHSALKSFERIEGGSIDYPIIEPDVTQFEPAPLLTPKKHKIKEELSERYKEREGE